MWFEMFRCKRKNIEILNEKHGMLTIVVLIIWRSFKCDDYVSVMHRINKELIPNCRTVKVYARCLVSRDFVMIQ